MMVRFNKKESAERRELLSSLNQMNDAKENEAENGKIQLRRNPHTHTD